MASLFPAPQQYFDNNGDPLAGGKVYFYEAGTTTPKNTFTTQAGDVANANPVILDSAGRASIWGTGSYKEVVRTSADVLISTKDAVTLGSVIDAGTVTNAMLADMAANTVKVRAASTSGVPSDVALSASNLLGRGSTGNVAAITLAGLTMNGTVLTGTPTLPHRSDGTNYPPANLIGAASSTLAAAADFIYVVPFIVPNTGTYTRISVHVQTAGTNNMRLGIYSDTNGVPDALVLDAGTVSVASTGQKNITISQSLSAGVYWLAFLAQSGGTSIFAAPAAGVNNILGMSDASTPIGALRRSFTYGALPSPFGTAPTAIGTVSPWIVLLR